MTRSELTARFMELYPELRIRLGGKLGSRDLADEALNETWLRLSRDGDLGPVKEPRAYLLRMAVNIAIDRRRAGARLASAADIDALLALPDSGPGPEREAMARLELQALERALQRLTPRRRQILVAVRLEGQSCRDVAEKLGVSRRTVEMELSQALAHCAQQMVALEKSGFVKSSPVSSK
jgi:RNA polymerase sigma factor (sigma-70 family)